jgi:hypothetical protein
VVSSRYRYLMIAPDWIFAGIYVERGYAGEVKSLLAFSEPPGDSREAGRQVVAVDRPERNGQHCGYRNIRDRRAVSNQTTMIVSEPGFEDVEDLADFFEARVRRRRVGDSCGKTLEQARSQRL